MYLDIERLRNDMEDYYGIAMFSGFPMAVMDLSIDICIWITRI